jgi:AcrR family transcriptional regulator
LLGILKNAVTILFGSVNIPGMLQNREQIESLLGNGFPELAIPGPDRLDELERLCRLESAELPAEHRLFSAIAACVREHGIHNTTIERIAEKMGTAKSSLYFYFPNKREMFTELIRTQTNAIRALCADRVAGLESLAEQIFAVLAVQANYLILRPDVLPVFGWIHFVALREQMECIAPESEPIDDLGPFRIEDLAPVPERKERLEKLIRWTSAMSTTTVIYSSKHGTSAEDARKNIRLMFLEMMNGDKE